MNEVPFFDRLIHDLKGPLSPLQTAAYLLRRDDLPAERRGELIDTLERQSRRLGLMIEEAGDWARATSGRLVSRQADCDLSLLLDMSVAGFSACTIEPEIDPALADARLIGDETRLQQLLAVLLGHALSRHPAPPQLRAHRDGDWVRIRIVDLGQALSEPLSATLFTEPSPEPYDMGLGLRLLIAQSIARSHGGQLQAVPSAGVGLTVECALPLA